VLVAVGHQCQEARALDGGVELALVDSARARQARGDDLAVLGNEVTQRIDILVVDFLDARDGETAETLALEQQGLVVAPAVLAILAVLVEFPEHGLNLLKLMRLKLTDMKHHAFAVSPLRQKALKIPETPQRLTCQPLGLGAKGHSLDTQRNLALRSRLLARRNMHQLHVQHGQARGRMAQGLHLLQACRQAGMVARVRATGRVHIRRW